jgi:hypothetical protein
MADISGNAIYSPPKEGLPHLVVATKYGEIAGRVLANSRARQGRLSQHDAPLRMTPIKISV